jgi:hypothetical protein
MSLAGRQTPAARDTALALAAGVYSAVAGAFLWREAGVQNEK